MSVNRMRVIVKDVFDLGVVVSLSLEFMILGFLVGFGVGIIFFGNKLFMLNYIVLK